MSGWTKTGLRILEAGESSPLPAKIIIHRPGNYSLEELEEMIEYFKERSNFYYSMFNDPPAWRVNRYFKGDWVRASVVCQKRCEYFINKLMCAEAALYRLKHG